MTIVAVTGHRPEKLLLPHVEIIDRTMHALHNIGAKRVYQGMAAGFDLLAAHAAYNLSIPFVACLPWQGWTGRKDWKDWHDWALENADEIWMASPSMAYPGPHVFHVRNRYMVDQAERLLAFWDSSPGGTANCVNYALDSGVFVTFVDTDVDEDDKAFGE